MLFLLYGQLQLPGRHESRLGRPWMTAGCESQGALEATMATSPHPRQTGPSSKESRALEERAHAQTHTSQAEGPKNSAKLNP